MSKKITIEPVTRVEGHGKVTIHLDDNNQVLNLDCISLNSEVLKGLYREDRIGKLQSSCSVFAESAR